VNAAWKESAEKTELSTGNDVSEGIAQAGAGRRDSETAMQRLNKPPNAPVSTALILVMGLAILPFSLRFAGVPLPMSPKLSGVMDALDQISDVLAANHTSGAVTELSVNTEVNAEQPSNAQDSVNPVGHFACNGETEKRCDTFGDIPIVNASKAACARRLATKRVKRITVSEQPVASIVIAGSEIKQFAALNAVNALNIAAERRIERMKSQEFREKAEFLRGQKKEFLKNFEIQFQTGFQGIPDAKNVTVPKNLKVTVKVKRAVASSQSTAQCKVFSAMALERRRECDRAALIGLPVVNVDNSEF